MSSNHQNKTKQELILELEKANNKILLLENKKNIAQQYLDLAQVMFVALDSKGTVILANKKACSILEYEHSEIIGQNWFDNFLPINLRKDVKEVFTLLMEGKGNTVEYYENPVLTKSGKECIIEWHNTYLTNDKNEITGSLSSGNDISNKLIIQNKLKENEEKLRILFNSTSDLIALCDENSNALWFNLSWKKTFSTNNNSNNLKNPPLFNFINENDKNVIKSSWKKMINEQISISNIQFKVKQKEYSNNIYSASIYPAEVLGQMRYYFIAKNITYLKKMEDEILKTRKLESLGILAGGIAHDFNNFLQGIIGNIYIIKKYEKLSSKGIECLKDIDCACTQAKSLAQQLLTFSKGGSPVKKTSSIENLIIESSEFVIKGSNCKCDFSISKNLWHTIIDKGQINQVISNLVINARQAMPFGGKIEIHVKNYTADNSVFAVLTDGNYIKISIIDQGAGIPEKYLDKIFDPYFSTKQSGSGLGLSTCYSIINNHNGLITIDSEPEIGTNATIYLPASDEKNDIKLKQRKNFKFKPGRRVLAMDDEKIVRNFIERTLIQNGFDCILSKCGEDAVNIYKKSLKTKQKINAVLLDLTVPGNMGGLEALKAILEFDKNANAIVMSGYSNDHIMANYKDYGFKGILNKPFKPEDIFSVLEEIVSIND